MTKTYNYRQIISEAIADEMREDLDVVLFGEDVAAAGGAFKTTPGLRGVRPQQSARYPDLRASDRGGRLGFSNDWTAPGG